MERKALYLVLGFTFIALVIAVLIPVPPADEERLYLPWMIETTEGGGSRVFGLTLGESTLGQAESRFREQVKVSIFARDEGNRALEGYFDSVSLNGIKAKVVAVMDVADEALEGMFKRGSRIATLGSGTRKVTLAAEDLVRVMALPISTITYLPRVDLSAELVEKRFGSPAEKITENGTDAPIEHWLYPPLGLDIALHAEQKDVLQYVAPRIFQERIINPLKQKALKGL